MKNILDLLGKKMLFIDGATGTMLQKNGLKAGETPEVWSIEKKHILTNIHKSYFDAGADIVLTNTFGANKIKLHNCKYGVEEIVSNSINNVKQAIKLSGKDGYVALDVGPTGKLLEPLGDLSFDNAYLAFKELMIAGEKAGADLIFIETMSDTYELKAAVLAAKENTNLPIFTTVVFDEKGKLLTGGDVKSVVAMLEGLGVDALGVNCGLGPIQMKNIVKDIIKVSSTPVIVKPNAGLPRSVNGKTTYDINEEQFANAMKDIAKLGVCVVGGCCGTTPEHISKMHKSVKDIAPVVPNQKHLTVVSSYAKSVLIDENPIIIGERINPTGKKRFKEALRNNEIDYILSEGLTQQSSGAHILDVNVGLPEINEVEMMQNIIKSLQSVCDLPLQVDTTNIEAMETALRYYNGKAMINSVNGKKDNMEAVFPLVKKYGGVVVALTLDESGIPNTAQGRYEIAKKIVDTAKSYGIAKENIVVDVLCMSVSSDKNGALTTLEALKMVKEKLGVKTILGVSNISFGLPQRVNVNSTFFTMALQNGLNCAIINPNSNEMMNSYYSYRVLSAKDENCIDYIATYGQTQEPKKVTVDTKISLFNAIEKGLKEKAFECAKTLVESTLPLDIIDKEIIPALDKVGQGFEKGTIFLPQLLMSAESAKVAFEVIKENMLKTGNEQPIKDKIILATVKGDIHDIGKNIVKVLLENYGYKVLDLGKDVEPTLIVKTAVENDVKLVGLSALMTTTVPSMQKTIELLNKEKPDCKVMVGGAVLTQEYADMIGADKYSKDAMEGVNYAKEILG